MCISTLYIILTILYLYLPTAFHRITLDYYCKYDRGTTPCLTQCHRQLQCGETRDHFRLFSDGERDRVVRKHNELRNKVAAGVYKGDYLPPSPGGLKTMSYDKEAEFVAACFAKNCRSVPDKIIYSIDGTRMGQNVRGYSKVGEVDWGETRIEDDIAYWFHEYRELSEDITQHYTAIPGTTQLTQLIWGATDRVGCARMHWMDGKKHMYYFFCNYIPKGNILNESLYIQKICPKRNIIYTNLCGDVRPLSEDTFKAPIDLNKINHLSSNLTHLFAIVITLPYWVR